jgi:HlyD family secretion protein
LLLLVLLLPSACEKKPEGAWLGYAEGDEALISAPQAGWVVSLKAERGQAIHRGDVLFVLDDTRELAGRDQAQASLAQAQAALTQAQAGQSQARSGLAQEQANLAYTRTELTRQDRLAQLGVGTPTQRDAARNAFQQSQARIGQLQAQIAQSGAQIAQSRAQITQMQASLGSASYSLSQRQVVAETEGPVQDIYFRQGEYVPASIPVLSVLPPANI